MAKSTRSKAKRSFRAQKRTSGVFAATDAARLQRLSAKLLDAASQPVSEPQPEEGAEELAVENAKQNEDIDMDTSDNKETSDTKISTHGPRNSRREHWRASKGLKPRPKSPGMNRQGGLAAIRKAGRSKRRR